LHYLAICKKNKKIYLLSVQAVSDFARQKNHEFSHRMCKFVQRVEGQLILDCRFDIENWDCKRAKARRRKPPESQKSKRVKGKRVKRKTIMMHRFILNAPRHLVVDHINHNGLDNRKSNLRLCTRAENSRNRRSFNNKSSRYKGVSWDKQRKLFLAAIRCNGKYYNLGRFKSETAAAKAYDKKTRELFGEFAYLNFPNK